MKFIDNKIILVGSYNSLSSGTGTSKGCVMLVDTSGVKIWNKSFGGVKDCGFTCVLIGEFNSLLICGTNCNYDSLGREQGWLFSINLNGDSLYQRLYNPNSMWPEVIYEINKTNDGFLISGFGITNIDSINSQDAWLLKVDSFGCLTPGCQLVGIDNIPFSREEIKIYPNPAKDKIQFRHSGEIISYRIADYSGKLLLAGNYLESGINIELLPSGAYVVQILLENKSQAFGKLLVEK